MASFTNDGGDGTTILPDEAIQESEVILRLTKQEAFALSDALQMETVVNSQAPHRLATNKIVFRKLFMAVTGLQ